jgi:spore germination protein GerM
MKNIIANKKIITILIITVLIIAGAWSYWQYLWPHELEKKDLIKVVVFFNNDKLDPEFSCNKVFPVNREIAKTEAVARAALEELLKGPTERDKSEGFFSNINPGVKIQKLSIEQGVAKVDFDEQLEFQVGGSCRVAAIRWQIIETLKQFPSVKEVVISINGRTEDILQP